METITIPYKMFFALNLALIIAIIGIILCIFIIVIHKWPQLFFEEVEVIEEVEE